MKNTLATRIGRHRLTAALLAALVPGLLAAPAATAEVNLYSYRQPFLIEPILAKFTEETGIDVNVVFAKKGMIDKIKAAGENNPADAVLTVDIGRLDGLVRAELLEPVESEILDANIPASLRHPDGLWFGLTTRGAGWSTPTRAPGSAPTRFSPPPIWRTRSSRGAFARAPASMATTSRSSPASSPATARRRRRNGSRG